MPGFVITTPKAANTITIELKITLPRVPTK
jgi:hypothetical protein